MINFILLTEPKEEATIKDSESNVEGGSEVVIEIDGTTMDRAYNYLESDDPRISDSRYAFPIGIYSDVVDFDTLTNTIGTYAYTQYTEVLDQATIGNLAMLASFYNMTATQIVDSLMIAGGNPANIQFPTEEIPQYFEVLSPIPVFDSGFATVVLELQ
jgi:hypothetical protein